MNVKNEQALSDEAGNASLNRAVSSPSSENRKLTFPRQRHLRSGRDFERIFAAKQKAANGNLVIFGGWNQLGLTRIGFSISRRHGNSVWRHRLRRLLREAYRLEQFRIPEGLDLVLIPGRDAHTATQQDFRESIVFLARRLSRQLPARVTETALSDRGDSVP